MKIAILDRDTLGEDVSLQPISKLGETSQYGLTSPDEVRERIRDAEAVVINKIKLSECNLRETAVRLICVAATGYDNIDLEYCRSHGIALANVPGYSTDSVAQLTVSMALSLVTHLREYRGFVHSGEYSSSGVANRLIPVYHEISSMKWGVIGGGGIGMRVADIAKSLGCRVAVCRRKNEGDYPIEDIDTILETSDIISVHLPLSDETRGIISRERIERMKNTAVFINTARGAVTDEEALADAILSKRISALGVDVYSKEPFGEEHPFSRLLGLDNVCLTPHMAWGSQEARRRCIEEIGRNIEAYQSGQKRNRIL